MHYRRWLLTLVLLTILCVSLVFIYSIDNLQFMNLGLLVAIYG